MITNRPLLECALKLRNLDEFKPLRDYLDEESRQHAKFLRDVNEDRPMHVAQGMARAVGKLKDLIDNAPALLEKAAPRSTGGI